MGQTMMFWITTLVNFLIGIVMLRFCPSCAVLLYGTVPYRRNDRVWRQ